MTDPNDNSNGLNRRDALLRGSAVLMSPMVIAARAPGVEARERRLAVAYLEGTRLRSAWTLSNGTLAGSRVHLSVAGASPAVRASVRAASLDIFFGADQTLPVHAWSMASSSHAQRAAPTRHLVPVQDGLTLALDVQTKNGAAAQRSILRFSGRGGDDALPLLEGTYFIGLDTDEDRFSWARCEVESRDSDIRCGDRKVYRLGRSLSLAMIQLHIETVRGEGVDHV